MRNEKFMNEARDSSHPNSLSGKGVNKVRSGSHQMDWSLAGLCSIAVFVTIAFFIGVHSEIIPELMHSKSVLRLRDYYALLFFFAIGLCNLPFLLFHYFFVLRFFNHPIFKFISMVIGTHVMLLTSYASERTALAQVKIHRVAYFCLESQKGSQCDIEISGLQQLYRQDLDPARVKKVLHSDLLKLKVDLEAKTPQGLPAETVRQWDYLFRIVDNLAEVKR